MKKKIFIAIAVMAIIFCVYLWIRKKRKTSVVNSINDAVSSSASSSGSSSASSSGSSLFPLKKGDNNDKVKQMQKIVNFIVGDVLEEDGKFGAQTAKFFPEGVSQDLYSWYNKIYFNALNAEIQKGEIYKYLKDKDYEFEIAFMESLYNGKITKEMVEYIRTGLISGSKNPQDDLNAVMTGNAFANGIY